MTEPTPLHPKDYEGLLAMEAERNARLLARAVAAETALAALRLGIENELDAANQALVLRYLDVPDQSDPTCSLCQGTGVMDVQHKRGEPSVSYPCERCVPDQPDPALPNVCTADGPASPPVCGEVCRYCPIPTTDEGMAEYERRVRALLDVPDQPTTDEPTP